ncbi:MAG TPA: hypothetical protein PLQ88_35015, partial [Blastocatellia bacterium]|nr:hypothetical protein [Blastocatellia bacterium]
MIRKVIFVVTSLFWISISAWAQEPPAAAPRISSQEEISAEFNAVPCKNKDRLTAVKALFEKMGAASEEISVEKAGGVENVLVRIAGTAAAEEKIVIGAHFEYLSRLTEQGIV